MHQRGEVSDVLHNYIMWSTLVNLDKEPCSVGLLLNEPQQFLNTGCHVLFNHSSVRRALSACAVQPLEYASYGQYKINERYAMRATLPPKRVLHVQ